MPFTPSHIAAVLPLRRLGVALPLAAMAAGSVSPDLPYFVPGLMPLGQVTHRPLAVISLDVVIGLLLWAGWRVGAGPLHELAPTSVRERWRPAGWRSTPPWTVPVTVALGAATHVAWDSFTHPHGFAVARLAILTAAYPSPFGGEWPGHQWAQYLSGAFGLIALAWVGWRQPRRPCPAAPVFVRPAVVTVVTAVAAIIGAAVRVVSSGAAEDGAGSVVFAGITGAMAATVIAISAFACWQALSTTRRARSTTSP
jgi:hypothetical protein